MESTEEDIKVAFGPPMGYYAVHRPTIWERLGFKECGAPWMKDEDFPELPPGRLITETNVYFDWKDRLRILMSGKVRVAVSTKSNVIVDTAISMSEVSVLPPNFPLRPKP